jgi:hypothetical protein
VATYFWHHNNNNNDVDDDDDTETESAFDTRASMSDAHFDEEIDDAINKSLHDQSTRIDIGVSFSASSKREVCGSRASRTSSPRVWRSGVLPPTS